MFDLTIPDESGLAAGDVFFSTLCAAPRSETSFRQTGAVIRCLWNAAYYVQSDGVQL